MSAFVDRVFWHPVIAGWLRFSMFSWRRLPVPKDAPQVHAPGVAPYRVLIAGDGAATGRGITTHDLGLPGYLARALSGLTGRATDVDITVHAGMTARDCAEAVARFDLSRFDAIVLSLGAVEAISFVPTQYWEHDVRVLLDTIARDAPVDSTTFMLDIPTFGAHPNFPAPMARAADRQAARLNLATRRIIAGRSRVRPVGVRHVEDIELVGAHAFEVWAAEIAPQIEASLTPFTPSDPDLPVRNEARRQAAIDDFAIADIKNDAVLDGLTSRARAIFGTDMAAITVIDGIRQTMLSADGIPPDDIARDESFCDVTIRRSEHFAVEDAALDSRFAPLRIVRAGPKVRFYAGYPVESPDGERIGAFCVLDSAPRTFTTEDAALLRLLALETQARIWELQAG